ncbi:MAG: hypothetical protein QUS12_12825 [Methanosarcina sp.]|nr:hypothetical protein [Methanosarcina sp.]
MIENKNQIKKKKKDLELALRIETQRIMRSSPEKSFQKWGCRKKSAAYL